MTMSCAVIAMSTAWRNPALSKAPASSMKRIRFRLPRLHALSSRCMYSEHGFDALMRSVFGQVCQSLMVVSNCMPGSPHWCVASAIMRRISRAGRVSHGWPEVTKRVVQVRPSTAARMKSSVTRTELLAFWKNTEPYAGPSSELSYPAATSAQALRSSSTLQWMNSTTSGWSAFSTTILAARRVLPPDLMTPAEASAARMNDTGPEAVPPPASGSRDERIFDKFTPEPDPPLKMTPSLRYQSRIESMVSWTERMKQAEHWGFGSTPTLNQTGPLNENFCCRSMCVSSSWKFRLSAGVAKYPCSTPHCVIVPTTRPTSWRTLRSRCGVPTGPRKYLDTTTLVASCDQKRGTSTSRCSNTTSPRSPWMTAERVSHSTSSYGSAPSTTKRRAIVRPRPATSGYPARFRAGALSSDRSITMLPPLRGIPSNAYMLDGRATYSTTSCAVNPHRATPPTRRKRARDGT